MGVPVRLSPTCSSLFSCLPLPWLLPAPSLRRAWRPLRLLPTSTTPLAMLLSTIPLQLCPMSMMSPAMLQSPTSTWSPLLPPLLPHLPSLTLPTLTPTLDTPMPSLPTTPAVSTTLAALCPVPKRLAFKLRPKDRQRTAKDRGRLENENWILEDVV